MRCRYIIVSLTLIILSGSAIAADNSDLTLWYNKPAGPWTEALPIGNGRMGAMIFGGVAEEHLQLNEDTIWAGGPYDADNPGALKAIPEARKLIFDGKYKQATDLLNKEAMAKPMRQLPYQPLGDLRIKFNFN